MRRDLVAAGLVALMVAAVLPAYARVFSEATWRGPVIVAAVLSLLLAAATRRLGAGMLAGTVTSAVGLALTLPWVLGLVARPTLPSLELVAQLRELFAASAVEMELTPAPAIPTAALVLPVVVGFWVVPFVAHEFLARLRRPGLALLSLTVLWASPLVVPMAPTDPVPLALPYLSAAALTLLVTGRWEDRAAEHDRLSYAGALIAGIAIVGALAAPGLLPGYREAPWVQIGGGGQPRGYQPIVDVGDRLQLPEERDVLRVRASQPSYLRLAGLDTFDGFTWRLGDLSGDGSYRPDAASLYTASGPLPPEDPAESTEPVYAEIEVLDLENIYVPVPYQPVEVLGPERDQMVWSVEGGFLAAWDRADGTLRAGVREGLTYRVRSARPSPTFDELAAIEVDDVTRERWTRLPRSYDALREQALDVYDEASATTNVERALALQEWFTGDGGDFTYDLDVPALRGDDALERFVLEDRVGYCEYFATAMAVMLRETGVPARVAVGFLPGERTRAADPDAGRELTEYTVSTSDAHAWVEVLFPGAGWVTFDPTPRSDDAQIVPTESDLAPIENVRERRAREPADPGGDAEDAADPAEPEETDDPAAETSGDEDGDARTAVAGSSDGAGRSGSLIAAVLLGGLLLGGIARVTAAAVRGRPRHTGPPGQPAHERIVRAQRELLTTGARYGVARRPQETTAELLRRWHADGRIDERGEDFGRIAQAASFGGHVDDIQADRAETLAGDLAGSLRDSASRRERLLRPVRRPMDALGRGARRARQVVRGRASREPVPRHSTARAVAAGRPVSPGRSAEPRPRAGPAGR